MENKLKVYQFDRANEPLLSVAMRGSDKWKPDYFKDYKHVVSIKCDEYDFVLEDVFVLLNGGYDDDFVADVISDYHWKSGVRKDGTVWKCRNYYSLSVGDIVQDKTGKYHMVDPFGFKEIKIN